MIKVNWHVALACFTALFTMRREFPADESEEESMPEGQGSFLPFLPRDRGILSGMQYIRRTSIPSLQSSQLVGSGQPTFAQNAASIPLHF